MIIKDSEMETLDTKTSIVQVAEIINAWVQKYPNATFGARMTPFNDYGDENYDYELICMFEREETPEEIQSREALARRSAESSERREREIYERLKARFEP